MRDSYHLCVYVVFLLLNFIQKHCTKWAIFALFKQSETERSYAISSRHKHRDVGVDADRNDRITVIYANIHHEFLYNHSLTVWPGQTYLYVVILKSNICAMRHRNTPFTPKRFGRTLCDRLGMWIWPLDLGFCNQILDNCTTYLFAWYHLDSIIIYRRSESSHLNKIKANNIQSHKDKL